MWLVPLQDKYIYWRHNLSSSNPRVWAVEIELDGIENTGGCEKHILNILT